MEHTPSLDNQATTLAKKKLRLEMETLRSEFNTSNPLASESLKGNALKNLSFPSRSKIASYSAFGSEISASPLAEALRAQGHTILFPVITGKSEPLAFRVYNKGDALIPGWRGILEPGPLAPYGIPDILLVPLLAFNEDLYRLGYGGGFYDRTIAQLRSFKQITAIGLGFSCQKVAELPLTAFDEKLDNIVTESNLFCY